jgi:GAF domain-containing protein
MAGRDMVPDDDLTAAGLLCRLQMLLQAAAAAPGDASVCELALMQAAAATGADSAVLGRLRGPEVMHVTLLFGAGEPVHDVGVLQVSPRYPLTDLVVRERSIWLSSSIEIRTAYPSAGGIWGRAFGGVPMLSGGVAVGALGVIHDYSGHLFTPAERTFLAGVADLCATVLTHPSADARPPSTVAPVMDA